MSDYTSNDQESQFEWLIEPMQRATERVAGNLFVGHDPLLLDASQSVWVAILNRVREDTAFLTQLQRDPHWLSGYLFVSVRREYIKNRKKQAAHRANASMPRDEQTAEEPASSALPAFERPELLEVLSRDLSPDEQLAVDLVLERTTYTRWAELRGVSVRTAQRRYLDGIMSLRRRLDRKSDDAER